MGLVQDLSPDHEHLNHEYQDLYHDHKNLDLELDTEPEPWALP